MEGRHTCNVWHMQPCKLAAQLHALFSLAVHTHRIFAMSTLNVEIAFKNEAKLHRKEMFS